MLSFLTRFDGRIVVVVWEVLQAAFDTDVYLSPWTDEDARTQMGFGLTGIGVQPRSNVDLVEYILSRHKSTPARGQFVVGAGVDDGVAGDRASIAAIKGALDILKVGEDCVHKTHIGPQAQPLLSLLD